MPWIASRGSSAAPPRARVLGTDLVIRALAILLVVVQHATLWPVPGGSAAMVVLIGYGIGRFQRETWLPATFRRFFRPLPAVLAPYFLILAGYALAWGAVPWASVFLLGNFGLADPADHTMLPFLYWFVEAYVQLLLVWAACSSSRPCAASPAATHSASGMVFLGGGGRGALRAPGSCGRSAGAEIFTLPWVLYLSVFGWCAACADTPRQALDCSSPPPPSSCRRLPGTAATGSGRG